MGNYNQHSIGDCLQIFLLVVYKAFPNRILLLPRISPASQPEVLVLVTQKKPFCSDLERFLIVAQKGYLQSPINTPCNRLERHLAIA